MQAIVITLASILLAGSVAFAVADYSGAAPESRAGDRLGRLYLLDDAAAIDNVTRRIDQVGFGNAGNIFAPALDRNAGSADRWSVLGEALLSTGKPATAAYCYLRAGNLAPHDLQTLLNLGDFYSQTNDPAKAVAAFSTILRESDEGAERALRHNTFVYYEHMKVRQNGYVNRAIPDAPSAREYAEYLMQEADPPAVSEIWRWAHEKRFEDDRLAAECANYFFDKQQFETASEGWNRHFTSKHGSESAIFNGGFEHELTGSRLDWQFAGYGGVSVSRDSNTFREGRYSLRVDFTGNDNPEFRHVRQVVFLKPGRYQLAAEMRTAGITSDQGVRLTVREGGSGRVLAETDAITGTAEWGKIETPVAVPPGVTRIDVELARHRSIRIDNQLTGTVWMDDVRLIRK